MISEGSSRGVAENAEDITPVFVVSAFSAAPRAPILRGSHEH